MKGLRSIKILEIKSMAATTSPSPANRGSSHRSEAIGRQNHFNGQKEGQLQAPFRRRRTLGLRGRQGEFHSIKKHHYIIVPLNKTPEEYTHPGIFDEEMMPMAMCNFYMNADKQSVGGTSQGDGAKIYFAKKPPFAAVFLFPISRSFRFFP